MSQRPLRLIKLSNVDIDWEALGLLRSEEQTIESLGIWTQNYIYMTMLVGALATGQKIPLQAFSSLSDTLSVRNALAVANYNLGNDGTNWAQIRLNSDFAQDGRARDTIAFAGSPADVSMTNNTETTLFSLSRNLRGPVLLQLRGDAAFTLTPRSLVGAQSWDFEDISVTTGYRIYVLRGLNSEPANLSGNLRGIQTSGATRILTVGFLAGLP